MNTISERSTKKDILDAYKQLLQRLEVGKEQLSLEEEADGIGIEGVTPTQKRGASLRGIFDTLDSLRTMMDDALEMFGHNITEFNKRIGEEDEIWSKEVKVRRDTWKREEEEYMYALKMQRRREEDEYNIKIKERDRQFSEKITVKEQELKERELKLKTEEEEIKLLRSKVELFPTELEKAIHESAKDARNEVEKKALMQADLISKDTEREREIARLTIQNLEETIKRQVNQIANLERQLTQAIERSQKLAVAIVEGGGRKVSMGENEKDAKGNV